MPGKLLVTGGAGYVGSHCCRAFAEAGWQVTVFDNLSTGWRDLVKWGPLFVGDLQNPAELDAAFAEVRPDAVAHFAGSALVAESVREPSIYYRNNTIATLNLLEAMRKHAAGYLIFSSTCATYGHANAETIDELHPQNPINPYGRSKLMVEQILSDFDRAHAIRSVPLRYFNAAGADRDGKTGERHACETHVIPLALKGAYDEGYAFTILGSDFEVTDVDQEFDPFTPETAAPASMSSISWAGADALELNTPAEDEVPVLTAAPVDLPEASERVAPRIPTGGTLFERMSNLSRGLSRSDDENEADDDASSVNIPRFLDRQNN